MGRKGNKKFPRRRTYFGTRSAKLSEKNRSNDATTSSNGLSVDPKKKKTNRQANATTSFQVESGRNNSADNAREVASSSRGNTIDQGIQVADNNAGNSDSPSKKVAKIEGGDQAGNGPSNSAAISEEVATGGIQAKSGANVYTSNIEDGAKSDCNLWDDATVDEDNAIVKIEILLKEEVVFNEIEDETEFLPKQEVVFNDIQDETEFLPKEEVVFNEMEDEAKFECGNLITIDRIIDNMPMEYVFEQGSENEAPKFAYSIIYYQLEGHDHINVVPVVNVRQMPDQFNFDKNPSYVAVLHSNSYSIIEVLRFLEKYELLKQWERISVYRLKPE